MVSSPISILTATSLSICTRSTSVYTHVHFWVYMCLLLAWLNLLGSVHRFSMFSIKRACIHLAHHNCKLVMENVRYGPKCCFFFCSRPSPTSSSNKQKWQHISGPACHPTVAVQRSSRQSQEWAPATPSSRQAWCWGASPTSTININ